MPIRALFALLFPLAAVAQDMPLFTFTVEGEGWKKAEGKKPDAAFGVEREPSLKGGLINATISLGGDRYTLTYYHSRPLVEPMKDENGKWKPYDYSQLHRPQSERITAAVRTTDKGTVYVAFSGESAVWAYTPDKEGKLTNGAPYARLRLREGYDNDKQAREKLKLDPPTAAVTALTIDSAGRLYAATERDLQVFDPTGRLSGVLQLPAKGKVDTLAWEGEKKDTLAAWVGEQKWTRKMKP